MNIKQWFIFLVLITSSFASQGRSTPSEEQLCGKWETLEENLIIQVYRENNTFKAKIIWFKDGDPRLMNNWTDRRNPDAALRSRKIIGLSVLRDLTYNADTNTWENGMIY